MKNTLKKNPMSLQEKKEFIKFQNKCYLCGESLNTYVEYLPKTYKLVERTQCHNCMTLIRVKNHPIQ